MPVGRTKDKVLRRDALPVPVNLPTKTRCINVEIPDDNEYELQFYSVLRLLCKWNSYQQDGGHKAADVAYLWNKALKITRCDETESFTGSFVEDCMGCGFQIDPDNNCILQIWCNGHWETFWDISGCISSASEQPTNGTPLEADECREWDVSLRADQVWLLPVAVSPGYTLEISSASGAWADAGDFTLWYCPSAENYALGICSGGVTVVGGDPLPAVGHMRLLATIDETFVDAYNQTITIQETVDDDVQVRFQANDSDLVGNQGTITFHVKVCNAGAQYMTFSMDSATDHVDTDFNTVAGASYRVTIDGYVCHNPSDTTDVHDAIWSSTDVFATHAITVFGGGPLKYGVLVNGFNIPELPYDAGHHYEIMMTGTGSPFTFKPVVNSPYASCGGSFSIIVEKI